MGVKGLWSLLNPVARPVQIESLEGKRLAIDSSIWLYQFQSTMRDKDGRVLVNAHVLGFLRRINRLLFHGIKPVFVFDGGAPALKRSTIAERKRRKLGAAQSHAKVAEKLLHAQMRREAVRLAQKAEETRAARAAARASGFEESEAIPENAVYLDQLEGNSGPRPPPPTAESSTAIIADGEAEAPPKKKYKRDRYELPAAEVPVYSTEDRPDARLATEEELKHFIEDVGPTDIDVESPEFRALPTEVQYEIIGDLRVRSRQPSHARLTAILRNAPTALDFSKAQIKHLSQRNALTQQLLTVTDSVGKAHLTIPVRVASERNREYVLVKKGEDEGGGWALGIREGTKDKPIELEPETENDRRMRAAIVKKEEEGSSDGESDISVEEIKPRQPEMDKDLREHRRREILQAITARYAPAPRRPSAAEHDPPPTRKDKGKGKENATPLFLPDELLDIEPTENDEALALALQQEELGSDEDEPDTDLARALALSRREAAKEKSPSPVMAPSDDSDEFEEVSLVPSTAASVVMSRAHSESQSQIVELLDSSDEEMEEVGDGEAGAGNEGVVRKENGPTKVVEISDDDEIQFVKRPARLEGTAQASRTPVKEKVAAAPEPTPAPRPPGGLRGMLASLERGNAPAKAASSTPRNERPPPPRPRSPSPVPSAAPQPVGPQARSPSRPVTIELSPTPPRILSPSIPPQRLPSPSPPRTGAPSPSPPRIRAPSPSPRPAEPASESTNEDDFEEVTQPSASAHVSGIATPSDLEPTLPNSLLARPSPSYVDAEADGEDEDGGDDDASDAIEWSRSPTPVARKGSMGDSMGMDTSFDDSGQMSGHASDVASDGEMGADDMVAEEDDYARFLAQIQNRDLAEVRTEIDDEIRILHSQTKAAMRDSDEITQSMVAQIQTLLRHFGIPYITAPMEAEAQCAKLAELGLVDGIITDDSDVFLFGGTACFKNVFNDSKFAECYAATDIERELSLPRGRLIELAYLLGSDYTIGLLGVGPVMALELLANFPGDGGLARFKEWWEKVQLGKDLPVDADTKWKRSFKKRFGGTLHLGADWPNPLVRDAYFHPQTDESDEPFHWGFPRLAALRTFLHEELSWSVSKVDDELMPIVQRIAQRGKGAQRQGTLLPYFDHSAAAGASFAPRRRTTANVSKRLLAVIKEFREAEARAAGQQPQGWGEMLAGVDEADPRGLGQSASGQKGGEKAVEDGGKAKAKTSAKPKPKGTSRAGGGRKAKGNAKGKAKDSEKGIDENGRHGDEEEDEDAPPSGRKSSSRSGSGSKAASQRPNKRAPRKREPPVAAAWESGSESDFDASEDEDNNEDSEQAPPRKRRRAGEMEAL